MCESLCLYELVLKQVWMCFKMHKGAAMATVCVCSDDTEGRCEPDYKDYFRCMFLTVRVLGFFLVPGCVQRAYAWQAVNLTDESIV